MMQVIDYSTFLDPTAVRAFLPSEARADEGIYERQEGIRFRKEGTHSIRCENVRLLEGAFLLVAHNSSGEVTTYRQAVSQSDWVHIQFRLIGGGWEDMSGAGIVQTPEGSCVVSRYPENCLIERTADTTNGWKTACVFSTPRALTRLLGIPAARLPQYVPWLGGEPQAQPRSTVLPLQSSMVVAVNDILSCPFRGHNRLVYMRGKSLELLSMVIHGLGRSSSREAPTLRLSTADVERVALARAVMCAHLESSLTLSELARKVGINRTKLALGFKDIYGVSVQAFWRDARLDHARQLLRDGETSVTEVAFSIGYSELSSFTRAFTRRFGTGPRECMVEGRYALNRDERRRLARDADHLEGNNAAFIADTR